MILDLFAGPGGWDVTATLLQIRTEGFLQMRTVGLEWDAAASGSGGDTAQIRKEVAA